MIVVLLLPGRHHSAPPIINPRKNSLKPSEIPLHQSCRCFLMASLLFRFCQPVNRTSPAEIPPAFVTSPAPLRILRNHHIRYVYCTPCIPSLFFPLYIPCASRRYVPPLLLPRTPLDGLFLTGQSLALHGIMGTTMAAFETMKYL